MKICGVCGGNLLNTVLEIDKLDRFELDAGVNPKNYLRSWKECQNCTALQNILPLESEIKLEAARANYYEVDFAGSSIKDKYNFVMSLPLEKSDNYGRVNRILDFLDQYRKATSKLSVLDIGAGTGVFLSKLIEQCKYDVEGVAVEPDEIAAEHLKTLSSFEVINELYSSSLNLGQFELVTLNKILEHIKDPTSFLVDLERSLSKTGLLYLEVPDVSSAWLRNSDDNILGPLHCNLYSPLSLQLLLSKVNLDILAMNRITEPSGKISLFAIAVKANNLENFLK